jgi:hypothetical protein
MAESYAKMDAASADGMKTSCDALADIPAAFAAVKDDGNSCTWCTFTHDGKKAYPFVAAGEVAQDFVEKMREDGPNFAGLRATVRGSTCILS